MVTFFFVIVTKKNVITLWSQNNFVIVTKKNVIVTRKSVIVTKSLTIAHWEDVPPTSRTPPCPCLWRLAPCPRLQRLASQHRSSSSSNQRPNQQQQQQSSNRNSDNRNSNGYRTATARRQRTASQLTDRLSTDSPTNQHPATRNNLHRSLSLQQSHTESAQWVWERVIFLSLPTCRNFNSHTTFFRSNACHHCWWSCTLNCFELYLHSSKTTRFIVCFQQQQENNAL